MTSTIFKKVNRVDKEICEFAQTLTMSDVYESMPASNRSDSLMSPRMTPLVWGAKVAGPAITAWCSDGDNLMMHRALYLSQPGDVLVVVCETENSAAQWGDIATRYAQRKGLAGVVIHGCARDVDQVRSLKFPVWSTLVHAVHPEKRGHGRINTPVVCDGVLVSPGDLVVADGDGVLIVPKAIAKETLEVAAARMQKEEGMISAMADGQHLWDLVGGDKILEQMGVVEQDAAFDD